MSPRPRPRVLIAGLVAAAIVIAGLLLDIDRVAATFLVAYTASVSVVLGMLALLMIAHLTTATWFGPFRRRAEAVIGVLPVLAVLSILVLPVLISIYRSAPIATEPTRRLYLAPPFLIARTIVYWIAWLLIAESLRATSRAHDTGDPRAAPRFRTISSIGLVVLGVTMTFASFDWMMSLTPRWYSTIYGVYWFAGGTVGALALLALLARSDRPSPVPVPANQLHSLGKLLLTFVMFWLYIGFAQYIVIWSGNIPSEVTWYIPRTHGGWGVVALVLLAGSFALPFLALLLRFVKRSHMLLAALGVTLLSFHYLDTYWLLMPNLTQVTWWTVVVSAATLVLLVVSLVVVSSSRESRAVSRAANR